MKILMSGPEIELMTMFMSSASSYFEFGMGGSTCLAAKLVKNSISAIDSDEQWVQNVRDTIGPTEKQIGLSHVNIGPTAEWGGPTSRKHQDLFPNYSKAIHSADTTSIDLCLVDGRFRVASFLEALSCLNGDAVIGFHDYQSRPAYHVVEEFARPIAACRQLSFFVRRSDADHKAIAAAAEAHRLNPA